MAKRGGSKFMGRAKLPGIEGHKAKQSKPYVHPNTAIRGGAINTIPARKAAGFVETHTQKRGNR